MADKLIERLKFLLRDWDGKDRFHSFEVCAPTIDEAAQAIAALTAERDALREALLEARGDMGAMGAMFNHYGFGKGQHLAGEGRSKIDDALAALKGDPANG